MKIRIVETAKGRRAGEKFQKSVANLSGIGHYPANNAEWAIVLTRAGFSEIRIEQFLAGCGAEGLEGELPGCYISSGKDDRPIFSARLLEGLGLWHDSHKKAPGRRVSVKVAKRRQQVAKLTAQGKTQGQIANQLGITTEVVKNDRNALKMG